MATETGSCVQRGREFVVVGEMTDAMEFFCKMNFYMMGPAKTICSMLDAKRRNPQNPPLYADEIIVMMESQAFLNNLLIALSGPGEEIAKSVYELGNMIDPVNCSAQRPRR
jgi:hypothetical protein